MKKIAIVTDSTADLPLAYYEQHDVSMVPLMVRFGEEAFQDWIEITPREFYKRMRTSNVLPKTSQPSVAQFAEVYQELAAGAEAIVSIHLSSGLSGTVQAAQMASEMVDVPVTVIDTKTASLGTGLIVDAAVRARDAGLDAEDVIKKVQNVTAKSKVVFLVGTLKFLQLGGRIGKAEALVGAMLNIKPILTLEDGIVVPYLKVKGFKKAYSGMKRYFLEHLTKEGSLCLGFAHADNPGGLSRLKEIIEAEAEKPAAVFESEIGCVIGAYVGFDAFAVVFYED